jgi:hypothetical protein
MKRESPFPARFQAVGVFAAALFLNQVEADAPALPGHGFDSSHYEALWTKSPFAVATSDAAPESPDYDLVGVAQFDGVSYASLVDKHNQQHFLVSGDKPDHGVTLVSITRGHDSGDTTAVVEKDGQTLTLTLTVPPAPAGAPNNPPLMGSVPNIPMPGTVYPNPSEYHMPGVPPVRFHRATINIPPRYSGYNPYRTPGSPANVTAPTMAPPPGQ